MDVVDKFKRMQVYDFTVAVLIVIAVVELASGSLSMLPSLITSIIVAAVFDYAINKFIYKREFVPKSGIITGMILGLVIFSPSLLFVGLGSAVAVVSKHVFVYRKRHYFNPAAFGLVLSALLLKTGDSWWGAGFTLQMPLTLVIIPLALLVSWKIRKLTLTFSFLVVDAVIYAARYGIGSVSSVDSLLGILSLVFFAGIMLVEPMTSAVSRRAMVAEGVLVALLNGFLVIFVQSIVGITDLLLVSLLIANLFVPSLSKFFP